ncbi:hypothetical protein [Streptomyces coerulescens]|uniref:SMODS and SLOG-associating 2TM effector domain-containing protein n=1 Tax=Streptomyces coerulescens TaxID=29304 RepID=A0ABW0CZ91_STRCD
MGVLLALVKGRKIPAGAPRIDGELVRRLDAGATRARYWVKRTPTEAVHLLRRARLYHLGAAALSIITGLLAWPVIADGSRLTAQIVLAALSCLAAVAVAAPYVTALHDRAEEAVTLCGTYGALYGELLRAHSQLGTHTVTPAHAAELLQQLDDLATRTDALKLTAPAPLPHQTTGEHPPPGR